MTHIILVYSVTLNHPFARHYLVLWKPTNPQKISRTEILVIKIMELWNYYGIMEHIIMEL